MLRQQIMEQNSINKQNPEDHIAASCHAVPFNIPQRKLNDSEITQIYNALATEMGL